MSKDKYLCTFSCQMETTCIVFNILQTFFTACTVGEYHLDVAQFELGNIQSSDVFRSIAQAKLFDELQKSIEISQRYRKSIKGFTMSN